jgi:flagellar biosynthesis/type III secretory pathway protein FliH
LSSKTDIAHASPGMEEFTYPPAPSLQAQDATDAAQTKQLWAAKTRAKGHADSNTPAQKEQQAWSKGHEAGKAEAQVAFEQQAAKSREEISKALHAFAAERDTYFQRVEEQVVRLTLSIARKILHREAQVDPLLLTGILRVALEKIGSGTNTRLRAHPSDIEIWRAYFTGTGENFPSPELIGDPEIQSGRCILETEMGTTEIGLETQLKEIEQGFLDLLAQRPGSS